jgi:hypothetical protein
VEGDGMNTKYTPGPWFVRTRSVGGEVVDCFVAAKDVHGLPYDAEILGDDEYRDGIDRRLADAHLIAAAPDLLDALQWLVDLMPDPELDTDLVQRREVIKAKAAILKATGEQQ